MSTIVNFHLLRVTGTPLLAALLSVAVPKENALATVWNVKLDATCPPAANYCRASAAVIPAGYELTIRHISCELTTAPDVPSLGQITLVRLNSAGDNLSSHFVPPILIGTSNSQWDYVVTTYPEFLIHEGTKAGVEVTTGQIGTLKALQCYLFGDL